MSDDTLEVIGTFNPGAAETDEGVKLLGRMAERPREQRAGYTALPRWQDGKVVLDWARDDELERLDARVVHLRSDGLLRLTSTSHLRLISIRDGRAIDGDCPLSLPETECEEYGMEHPRIMRIENRFYITYVCV